MTEDGDGTGSTPITETFTHRRHGSKLKGVEEVLKPETEFVSRLRWPDFIAQVFVHLGCLYGFYLMLVSAKIYTTIFGE